MSTLFELIKDPYDRKARAVPGLLSVLPLLIPLLVIYGPEHPTITAVVGLLGGCGAIFALANVARGRGKHLEGKLVKEWGGIPTTIVLRHRDTFLDRISKNRYHEAISTKLGIDMPTAEEEEKDPSNADEIYIGATRQIRELTRKNNPLLLSENISYGFHRNMLGMKPVGVLFCLIGIGFGLMISNVLKISPPYVFPTNIADPGLAGGLTLLVSASMLFAWIFYFNRAAVRRIGFAYAERLLECLPSLPTVELKDK